MSRLKYSNTWAKRRRMRPQLSPGSSSICLHGCNLSPELFADFPKLEPLLNMPAPRARCGLNFSFLLSGSERFLTFWPFLTCSHSNLRVQCNQSQLQSIWTGGAPCNYQPPPWWQGHLVGTYPWPRGMFVHIKTDRSGPVHNEVNSERLSRTHRKPALQTWSNEWFLSQPGNKTSCAILWFWIVATTETSSRNKWPNVCERLPKTTITTYHSLMTRLTLTHGYFSCCSDLRIGSWTEIRSECVGQRVRVSSVSELRKTTDAAWFQAGCARALVKSSRTIEIQHVCMMSLQLHII